MRIEFNRFISIDCHSEQDIFNGFSVYEDFNFSLFGIAQEVTFSEYIPQEECHIIVERGLLEIVCEWIAPRRYSVHVDYCATDFDFDYCANYIHKTDFAQVIDVTSNQIGVLLREILAKVEIQFRVILFKDYGIMGD